MTSRRKNQALAQASAQGQRGGGQADDVERDECPHGAQERPRLPAGQDQGAERVDRVSHRVEPGNRAQHVVNAIRWQPFPAAFLLPLKTFALAALDHQFPLDLAVGRSEVFANVATVQAWLCDLLVFATWLEDQGIKQLTDVTGKDLDAYRVHVMALARSAGRKACLFNAVRALWAYREHLPRQCQMAAEVPWSGASGHQLAQAVTASRVNKTPRIDPATMEALPRRNAARPARTSPGPTEASASCAIAWPSWRQTRPTRSRRARCGIAPPPRHPGRETSSSATRPPGRQLAAAKRRTAVGGKRRDRAAEQAAVTAAAERLLAAAPLRSATGKLTVSELITEAGLRRDIVYDHPHLVDAFKARARARDTEPAALRECCVSR